MDVKVSNKQPMMQPQGMVEVLVAGIFDFYPVYDNPQNPALGWIYERDPDTGAIIIDPNTEQPIITGSNYDENLITDIEIFSEEEWLEEELDRVSFAVIRSRGQDPISPAEGVQWSEMLLGEIPVPLLMQQIMDAGAAESQFVNTAFDTVLVNGQEQLTVVFNTVDPTTVQGRSISG